MRAAFLTSALAFVTLAGCDQPPAGDASPVAPEAVVAASSQQSASTKVEGWEADPAVYARLNQVLPPFSGKLADSREISSESLRNRWTILGVWPEGDVSADEIRFASALNSAVDQDPDLDLLIIHNAKSGAAATPPSWPALMDDGTVAGALGVPATPAYLLIGPDLAIEAYRGALSATPDDGIKSVIRGVAEVRKQIAAPQ